MSSSLPRVLASLELTELEPQRFLAEQLDDHSHHIVGGHLTAQALVAASKTAAEGSQLRSIHADFVRAGDPRLPVEFVVATVHDGRSLGARRVTAWQAGKILMEASVSLGVPVAEPAFVAPSAPAAVAPDKAEQLARMGGLLGVDWFERRGVVAEEGEKGAVWWRPDGGVGVAPVVALGLAAHFSAALPVAPALAARTGDPGYLSALIHYSAWFHAVPDLTEWVLYEQTMAAGANARALGVMTSHVGREGVTSRSDS